MKKIDIVITKIIAEYVFVKIYLKIKWIQFKYQYVKR